MTQTLYFPINRDLVLKGGALVCVNEERRTNTFCFQISRATRLTTVDFLIVELRIHVLLSSVNMRQWNIRRKLLIPMLTFIPLISAKENLDLEGKHMLTYNSKPIYIVSL